VLGSFISTKKLELDLGGDRDLLIPPQQLQRDLAFWIEDYYNRQQPHSIVGHLSPMKYEHRAITAPTLSPVNTRTVPMESGTPRS
jgi:putative transposase